MSLRLRIGLWYGALTSFVLVLVCTYSYAVHGRTHYDELDRVLHGAADHVVAEMNASTYSVGALRDARVLGIDVRVERDSGPRGRTASDNTESVHARAASSVSTLNARTYPALGALAPSLHAPGSAPGHFGVIGDTAGNRFRTYVAPLEARRGFVSAVVPLAPLDAAVSQFGRLMLITALLGGVGTFVAGWLLARRALQPVTALTDAAAAIASSRELSRRVTEGPRLDELGCLARTFNAMLSSIEAAYEAQVRFVSAASHELRTPLTVIQANLDLLASGRVSNGEQTTAVREAHSEARRMSRLVADLLVLARADAAVAIRRDLVELDRLLLQTVGEARHLVTGQRLVLRSIAPSLVEGDADQLKQLLLNVLENALKYTPLGGQVGVALARDGCAALVRIDDTGIGIAPEDLSRVFERFYRADPARSRDPGGSGLGLSIARWVATEHGGTLELSSAPGRGTTVTIRLPAAV